MQTVVYMIPAYSSPDADQKEIEIMSEFLHNKVRRRINEMYYSHGYIKRGCESYNDLMDGIILTGKNPDIVAIINTVGYEGYDLADIAKIRELCEKEKITLIERY